LVKSQTHHPCAEGGKVVPDNVQISCAKSFGLETDFPIDHWILPYETLQLVTGNDGRPMGQCY